jgi:hypothetical protein
MGRGQTIEAGHTLQMRLFAEPQEQRFERVALSSLAERAPDPEGLGALVTLGSGSRIFVEAGNPVAIARGFADVARVSRRSDDGRYLVRLRDGSLVLVDASIPAVAALDELTIDDPRALGAYGAVLCLAAAREESDPSRLASALRRFRVSPSGESLATLAREIEQTMIDSEKELHINDPALRRQLDDLVSGGRIRAERGVSSTRLRRARGQVAQMAVADSLALSTNAKEVLGVFYGWESDDEPYVCPPDVEAARREAAETLGVHVPDGVVDDLYLDEDLRENLGSISNLHAMGQRAFSAFGPPGTGKSVMGRVVAEAMRMPFVEINVGSGFSFQESLGGDGISQLEVRDEKSGELKATIPISAQLVGPLTRAAEAGAAIQLNEVAGDLREQMTALHDALGSGLADPNGRFLTINSASAGRSPMIRVHPDTIWFLTWNNGPHDDRPKDATLSRTGMFEFTALSAEQMAGRYSVMASKLMRHQQVFPELQREWPVEDLLPLARIDAKLQNLTHTDPDLIRTSPAPRYLAHCYGEFVMQAAAQSVDESLSDREVFEFALRKLNRRLRPLLTSELTPAEKDARLATLLDDNEASELERVASTIRSLVRGG